MVIIHLLTINETNDMLTNGGAQVPKQKAIYAPD